MEISKKTKQIGIAVGIGIVGITAIGYYYYLKPKELGYDELERLKFPKLPKSQWENRAKLDEMLERGEEDVRENYKPRSRFTVYNSGGNIEKRFKVLEKDESVIDRTGRFRTSGERYKHTPSGYNFNRNNRNATLSDLIIP